MSTRRPRIALIVPRGDAVRAFLQSEVLDLLAADAEVFVLSTVVSDEVEGFVGRAGAELIPISEPEADRLVSIVSDITEYAHFRRLDSAVVRNMWEARDATLHGSRRMKWQARKALSRSLAFDPVLDQLDRIDQAVRWKRRTSNEPEQLLARIAPDLVFNCSHIHGPAGGPFVLAAKHRGTTTAGFVFSWDNITSRGRIHEPYDHLLTWNQPIRQQVLDLYDRWAPDQVHVVGTPQFDFHHDPALRWTREELCAHYGLDPARPYIVYTAGMARHFPEEHRTVARLVDLLPNLPRSPQLLVRLYLKDISTPMRELAATAHPDAIFPSVSWDPTSLTPLAADLAEYPNLLRHAAVGVNAASTVSLELMLHDVPVVNLGFDPPGSHLPHHERWVRHIDFDHYRPVAASGAVMVARTPEQFDEMVGSALEDPARQRQQRQSFIDDFLGDYARQPAAPRVASLLLELAQRR